MPDYACSVCGKPTSYEGALPALYPFCTSRCRLIDLGRWFNEQYSIDRDLSPEDGDEGAPVDPNRSSPGSSS